MTGTNFFIWCGLALALLSAGLYAAGLARRRVALTAAAIGVVGAALFAVGPAALAAIN